MKHFMRMGAQKLGVLNHLKSNFSKNYT